MKTPKTTYLSAALVVGLSLAMAGPAFAVEPAPLVQGEGKNPVSLTPMNWFDDTTFVYRLKNSSAEDVTGTIRAISGGPAQAQTVTVPANSTLFVGFTGTIGTFHQVKFDGPGKWDKTANSNQHYATGHVEMSVVAEGEVPEGFQVAAQSSIEQITWTWDGSAWVVQGDQTCGYSCGAGLRYVMEGPRAGGDAMLDVPMDETYTITYDEAEGVEVTLDNEPATIPAFDSASLTDPGYVDQAAQQWYTQNGKYAHTNAVVVQEAEEPQPPVDPEPEVPTQPEPPVGPEPEVPTQPEVPVGPEPEVPTQPEVPQVEELPQTGAGTMLLGLAAATTLAGAGLTGLARRAG